MQQEPVYCFCCWLPLLVACSSRGGQKAVRRRTAVDADCRRMAGCIPSLIPLPGNIFFFDVLQYTACFVLLFRLIYENLNCLSLLFVVPSPSLPRLCYVLSLLSMVISSNGKEHFNALRVEANKAENRGVERGRKSDVILWCVFTLSHFLLTRCSLYEVMREKGKAKWSKSRP